MAFSTGVLLQAGVEIRVEAEKSKGPVREMVFGHNLECADNRGLFGTPSSAPEPRSLEVKYGQGYWDPEGKRPAPGVIEIMKTVPFGSLRYPGGCLAHNFRWKETIGPIAERGSRNWAFGLDEYIELCRALKCEPQIIITDYGLERGEIPQDAADLVEYLNMPAEPRYPWAMKRAANGHPEPYGVRYFEMGNESIHGNHGCSPTRRYSAAEYVDYFNETAAAMKKVDPSIQIGTQAIPAAEGWDRIVFDGTAKNADFAIIHSYYPQVESLKPGEAFKAVMAGNEQFGYRLAQYVDAMRKAGRLLPIGITEFNIRSIKGSADAYRYSYLAGMQCSELWCRFLQPENNILTANYWHLLNAMYGVIVTIPGAAVPENYTGKLLEMKAAARFFQTLKSFTGQEIVPVEVKGAPRYETVASPGVLAARGDRVISPDGKFEPVPIGKFNLSKLNGKHLSATGSAESGELTIRFDQYSGEAYPEFAFISRPANIPEGDAWQIEVSFEARYTPAPDCTGAATLGLGFMDARGWNATHCAQAVYAVNTAREWTKFSARLNLLNDTRRVALLARMQHTNGTLTGTLEFRDLKAAVRPAGRFPAYSGMSSFATKSADGRKLFLIVFNRSLDETIPAQIDLDGFNAGTGRVETLYQENPGMVKYFDPVRETVKVDGAKLNWSFLPHSMTAFEFDAK